MAIQAPMFTDFQNSESTFPTADNALVAPFRLEIALDHTLLACLSKMPTLTETAPGHHATIFCLRI